MIESQPTAGAADLVWKELLATIIGRGTPANPRHLDTMELINVTSVVDMQLPFVVSRRRKLSYNFMAAEALWILEGRNDVEPVAKFAPSIRQFSDDGKVFYGAYGPWVQFQLDYVTNALLKDSDTRQAVMTIWRRNPPVTKDCPCTVAVQWLIRDGKLHCLDTMRSSDTWLGWPYDVFNFTTLSTAIGLILRRKGLDMTLGNLYLTAGSQHLYGKNLSRALDVLGDEHQCALPLWQMSSFNDLPELIRFLTHMRDEPMPTTNEPAIPQAPNPKRPK